MKYILLFVVFFIAFCNGDNKKTIFQNSNHRSLDKLSTDDALLALRIIDNITSAVTGKYEILRDAELYALVGMDYTPELREKLYQVINSNTNQTSRYARLLGLISFQNIIILALVLVGLALFIFLMKDVLLVFSIVFGMIIHQIFFRKEALYFEGLALSGAAMIFKIEQVENNWLRYLFIFDWLTPFFGCLLFYIVCLAIYMDFFDTAKPNDFVKGGQPKHSTIEVDSFVLFVWAFVAIYHDNWMVGVATVMLVFSVFGFSFGTMFLGYFAGFENKNAMLRCTVISIILNAVMVAIKMNQITGNITVYLSVFETGVYFWATLVGSLAMLIASDEYYIRSICTNGNWMGVFVVTQLLMGMYCALLLFFGNTLYIQSYCSIGGTIAFLWGLDIERAILSRYKGGSITFVLFILFVNLYALKQLITLYPDYFIF